MKKYIFNVYTLNVYTYICLMNINEAIKSTFSSETQKATINILYTAAWINQMQTQFFKPYGITAAQYNVLRILKGQSPNPITVAEIINRMIDKSSNASRIIDRLEKKHWVSRTTCKQDRRQVDVKITTNGLELLDKIAPDLNEMEKQFNHLNNQDLEQLNLLLDTFRNQ